MQEDLVSSPNESNPAQVVWPSAQDAFQMCSSGEELDVIHKREALVQCQGSEERLCVMAGLGEHQHPLC